MSSGRRRSLDRPTGSPAAANFVICSKPSLVPSGCAFASLLVEPDGCSPIPAESHAGAWAAAEPTSAAVAAVRSHCSVGDRRAAMERCDGKNATAASNITPCDIQSSRRPFSWTDVLMCAPLCVDDAGAVEDTALTSARHPIIPPARIFGRRRSERAVSQLIIIILNN